ncbi:glutamate racemase [Aureicoccus marinus]|uniref:Glutamate racemase n=1 Tax=Aureicoccus marinus TaxID=754435 RepID=A0A2S7TBH6_9FLAO|nr:glutamate racemase [Aureicoccus marinus]PQJ16826.1 glutamate racemase [Aureicoccus marinus]
MNTNQSIGFFDSGVGGLSVWREVNHLLPTESTVYVADSGFAPYGQRTAEVIRERSHRMTRYLLEQGSKLIVVACNTATTNAIAELRKSYSVPFIGIEPAIKPAALKTQTGNVGVLATQGTLTSSLFHQTRDLHTQGIQVIERVGTGLVEAIETGDLQATALQDLLEGHLEALLKQDIDVLVLGCTHYPFLEPLLRKRLPSSVQILDSGEAVARQTAAVLQQHALQKDGNTPAMHQFFSTGKADLMQEFLRGMNRQEVPQALRL